MEVHTSLKKLVDTYSLDGSGGSIEIVTEYIADGFLRQALQADRKFQTPSKPTCSNFTRQIYFSVNIFYP
jgi:hypothetical protein